MRSLSADYLIQEEDWQKLEDTIRRLVQQELRDVNKRSSATFIIQAGGRATYNSPFVSPAASVRRTRIAFSERRRRKRTKSEGNLADLSKALTISSDVERPKPDSPARSGEAVCVSNAKSFTDQDRHATSLEESRGISYFSANSNEFIEEEADQKKPFNEAETDFGHEVSLFSAKSSKTTVKSAITNKFPGAPVVILILLVCFVFIASANPFVHIYPRTLRATAGFEHGFSFLGKHIDGKEMIVKILSNFKGYATFRNFFSELKSSAFNYSMVAIPGLPHWHCAFGKLLIRNHSCEILQASSYVKITDKVTDCLNIEIAKAYKPFLLSAILGVDTCPNLDLSSTCGVFEDQGFVENEESSVGGKILEDQGSVEREESSSAGKVLENQGSVEREESSLAGKVLEDQSFENASAVKEVDNNVLKNSEADLDDDLAESTELKILDQSASYMTNSVGEIFSTFEEASPAESLQASETWFGEAVAGKVETELGPSISSVNFFLFSASILAAWSLLFCRTKRRTIRMRKVNRRTIQMPQQLTTPPSTHTRVEDLGSFVGYEDVFVRRQGSTSKQAQYTPVRRSARILHMRSSISPAAAAAAAASCSARPQTN